MDYYPLLKNLPPSFDVLLPFSQYAESLEAELIHLQVKIYIRNDKIFFIEKTNKKFIWAQDHWSDSKILPNDYSTIQFFRSLNKLSYYHCIQKNKFIENKLSQLRIIPEKRISYPVKKPFKFDYFIWTNFDSFIIYSENNLKNYPAGWHEFVEEKEFPPNRAYLKLWEAFTVLPFQIDPLSNAIEIGASPGGWSWVLSQKFNTVYTFDRADLAKQIKVIPNIKHHQSDAFKINPNDFQNVKWLFSDLICTPEKIYETIQFWLNESPVRNFLCTIKFKGPTPFAILEKLLQIPNSTIVRLYHNKNEVTWFRQESKID